MDLTNGYHKGPYILLDAFLMARGRAAHVAVELGSQS